MVRVSNGGCVLVRKGILPEDNVEFFVDDVFAALDLLPQYDYAGLRFRKRGPFMLIEFNGHDVEVAGRKVSSALMLVVERSRDALRWYRTDGQAVAVTTAA
jgi:hypothetical protein